MRHNNNYSTTPSRFIIVRCRHGRCGTTTITQRPQRGSQWARCRRGRSDTITTTRRPHRGHNRLFIVTVNLAQTRLDDPIEFHNPRAAVTIDSAQNNDSTTPTLFTIGALPPRSIRHKNNDTTTTSRFTIGALPARSIRHKNYDPTTQSGGSQSAMCATTVDAAQQTRTRRPPSRFTIGYLCHHGRCGTKTTTRRPHRGSLSALCRRGRSDTKTRTRPHRGSQTAICATTVDAAQNNDWTTPSKFTIGALPSRHVICPHLNLAIWILIWLMTMFIWVFVLIGMAHSLKLKKLLHDKASKAMYSLIQKGRRLKLPTDIMLKLFDSSVAPILLYGCEVWGYENTDIIEKVHTKFCKFIFGVSKFSHNMPIYGELGRYPLSITIKQRMICYWTRILKSNQHKLNKVMYDILYNLHCKDTHSSGWIKCINTIFQNNGMSYIWATHDFKVDSNNVHKCECDQFKQLWHSRITCDAIDSNDMMYKTFKYSHGKEKYTEILPEHLKQALFQFRMGTHKLPVNNSKHFNVPRADRHCTNCDKSVMGDEIHFLYECTKLNNLRAKYLFSPDIRREPNVFNFVNIMQTNDNWQSGKVYLAWIETIHMTYHVSKTCLH